MPEDEPSTEQRESNLSDEAGAPRWTYVVAALISAAGLVWAIVAFFLKQEPAPAKPAAASTPSVNVSVSGSGNVGIGTMSGGDIKVGVPAASSASASASGKP
jgi:hypothetical protein